MESNHSRQDEHNFGGAYALAGFLFQAVGVGSLAATIHTLQSPNDGSALRLSLEGDTALTHEQFGQDAVLVRQGGCQADGKRRRTFIQFKHSHDPDCDPCQPKEMLDIIDGLKKSQTVADKQIQLDADFMLIMNRTLSDATSKMIDNAANNRKDDRLGKPTQKKPERLLLQNLTVVTITTESLLSVLSKFARERGILEVELEAQVGNLVSAVLGLSGGHRLTQPWLTKKLTGVENVSVITPAALRSRMTSHLAAFANNIGMPQSVVRREVTDDIHAAMLEKPIIALIGSGGRGKSVVQHQLLSSRLKTENCYVLPTLARGINRDNWLAHQVLQWRGGNPELPTDASERALRRLQRAQASPAHPLLLIDIDGLDEAMELNPQYQAYVSQILDLACAEYSNSRSVSLSIVVSCRLDAELERAWPNFRQRQTLVERIPITDFSDSELMQALSRSDLQNDIIPRLPTHLRAASPLAIATHEHTDVQSYPPLPRATINAIRHPMLFGCLMDLDCRADILLGSTIAFQRWAAKYVQWFASKTKLRHPEFDGIDIQHLLRCIAKSVSTQERPASRLDHWIPAARNGEFDGREAKTVYREATSFGIISEVEDGGWLWSHDFVWEYLNQPNTRK